MPLQKIGWEVQDLDDLDLPENIEEEGPWSDPETKAAVRKATKAKAKKKAKTRRRAKAKDDDEAALELLERAAKAATDPDPPPWDDPASPARDLAELAQRPPRMECPVCRSVESCECDEEERAFVRRTRFEKDVETLARCRRCSRPLSVVYIKRPGSAASDEGYRLNCFDSIYACAGCSSEALASVVLSQAER